MTQKECRGSSLRMPRVAGLCAPLAARPISRSVLMADRKSISGLTDDEAQEFHAYYMQGMVGFTAVAVIAHILVWAWRPWFV
jgi:light-harvesting complex 1 beta chain